MVALQLAPGAAFDPNSFDEFLAGRPDAGVKWSPRFVRVTPELPTTATSKILTRHLRAERWECDDPVWWRPERGAHLRRLTRADVVALRQEFAARGRERELDAR